MFNLMRKDFILQKDRLIIYLGLLLFYLWSDFYIVISVGFITSLFVMNSHYYDEREKINIMLNSLPYTRKEIVSAKYIEAIIVTAIVLIFTIIGKSIFDGTLISVTMEEIILCFIGTMIFTAIYLPFFFKFTQQYLLVAFAMLFVIVVMVARIVIDWFSPSLTKMIQFLKSLPAIELYSIAIIVVILFYAISWMLSIRIYSKKAF